MNRHLIFALILTGLLTSCGKEKKQDEKTTTIQKQKVVTDSFAQIPFDWTQTGKLKKNTIEELKKKEKTTDKIVMSFIRKYTKLVDELNEILIKYKGYDSLNNSYLSDKILEKQFAFDFNKKVEVNGFRLASSEGMIYISQNTDFIKSETIILVDSISNEFINLYCIEFDNVCCEDAGIVIPTEELINRIYKWGELSKKTNKLEYKEYVENEFHSNLSLLFTGLDNTLSFDSETKKFNEETLNSMTKFIENKPNSRATNEFKEFIELLKAENFEETQKVDDYLKKKLNYCG